MIGAAFSDSVIDAQATFRAVLDATARPGKVVRVRASGAPRPLSAGAAAIALTLCDQDTPVWLDAVLRTGEVVGWLRFHTGARIVDDPGAAAFAFVGGAHVPEFGMFAPGTADYPDRSATLVLQVESFARGPLLTLTGPGIRGTHEVRIAPLPDDMPARLAANRRLFPCGVDLLFAADSDIMALPRSVHVSGG